MSYIDAIFDRKTGQIEVVERNENGERVYKTDQATFIACWPDERGTETSIYGYKLKKFQTKNINDFNKELAILPKEKLHESDIKPIFRYLHDNYKNARFPDLNVGIFDIETEFDQVRGYSTVDDSFSPINAISIYLNWLNRNFTLVTKPNKMTKEAAQTIVNEFEDTLLCDSEKELLETFLDLIEDCDILSGWNCIGLKEYVACRDRLLPLGKINENQTLVNGQNVVNTHYSGLKKKNILTTVFGHTIDISDEHVLPIYIKSSESVKNLNTLIKSRQECSIKEIKDLLKTNDVYIEHHTKKNNNSNLTFKEYIVDYLDLLYDTGINFVIDDRKLRKQYMVDFGFKSTNYRLTYAMIRNLVSKEYIFDYINSKNIHMFYIDAKSQGFEFDISQTIPNDILQILGLIYTNGFFSNYDRNFKISNIDSGVITGYEEIFSKYEFAHKLKDDGCNYTSFSKQNMFGMLLPMIYERIDNDYKKRINVEILSRLSIDQFAAYYSGMIDGNGSISNEEVTWCNFNDDVHGMSTLLSWFGVYSTQTMNHTRIPTYNCNMLFIDKLTLLHSVKKETFDNLRILNVENNSANKNLNAFHLEDYHIIKIKDIIETDEYIEMGDIQTTDHYFICNGIRVHNSTGYDIPYIYNRIVQVLGKNETKRLCLWGKYPKRRDYEKFGKQHFTYDLIGRVHLDYLDLYQKNTFHEMHSYRLDFVGEYEVGDKKTQYEGNLDQLFNNDFKKFIEYNRQDVMLLVKIDKKKRFIELANKMAHTNCVLFQTTMGAVALIDQAIVNAAHDKGLMVPSRKDPDAYVEEREWVVHNEDEEELNHDQVAGAYVAYPKKGMHDWIGGVDINSLYPSAIRALNMSLETIVGQIRPEYTEAYLREKLSQDKTVSFAEAWNGLFGTLEYNYVMDRTDDIIICDFEDGTSLKMTANEMYQYVFESDKNLIISANGTLFDGSRPGLIPEVLTGWIKSRKEMQKTAARYLDIIEGIELPDDLAEEVSKLL